MSHTRKRSRHRKQAGRLPRGTLLPWSSARRKQHAEEARSPRHDGRARP